MSASRSLLNLSLEHPAVIALRAEFDHLRETAIAEANDYVKTFIRGYVDRRRFQASRLARSPRDRVLLQQAFLTGFRPAIAKRLGQLNRVDDKLHRICLDWPRHTADELSAPPADWGRGP